MEDPLAAIIHRFKYGGCPHLALPLASLVARRISTPSAHGVLAVPLHRARRRERGYDQAELLARALAARWGLPYVSGVVSRRRSTRAQARLSESQRFANVTGAFSVTQPNWVSGRVWVVVDDVVTTASTTNSVLSTLRLAGARGAVPVALALA
jgi:ComF family protein